MANGFAGGVTQGHLKESSHRLAGGDLTQLHCEGSDGGGGTCIYNTLVGYDTKV